MKIISKIIAWILSIIFVFIALNLIVWLIKYGGISNYSDFLNKKDRNTTISQISIKDPKSIFSLFYWEYTPKDKKYRIFRARFHKSTSRRRHSNRWGNRYSQRNKFYWWFWWVFWFYRFAKGFTGVLRWYRMSFYCKRFSWST